MPTVAVNGTSLYYESSGSGTPLLFIHGTGGSAAMWEPMISRLSPDFRCISYDRRGNARSSAGQDTNGGIEDDAQDASALIRALDVGACHIVALSWGAAVAVEVARRQDHLVKGMVLGEPTIFSLAESDARALLATMQPKIEEAVTAGGPRSAVDAFYNEACGSYWSLLSEQQREPFRANANGMFRDLQAPEYGLSATDLEVINIPCLLLVGTHALKLHREVVATMSGHLPNSRVVPVENSGHVVFGEQPDACAAAVKAFVPAV